MKMETKCFITFFIFLVLASLNAGQVSSQGNLGIFGRVVDAKTGLPISGAKVIFWDSETLEPPTLGNGLYITDANGDYFVSENFLKIGKNYYVYAFEGDFFTKNVRYVPSSRKTVNLDTFGVRNISFSLYPGALIQWEGTSYLVQASSPEDRATQITVFSNTEIESSTMTKFGDVADIYYISLDSNTAIVPADVPVVLEAKIYYYSNDPTRIIPIDSDIFRIYNGSLPFLLHQGDVTSFQIAKYSLRRGIEYAERRYVDISSQLNIALSIGFDVFDEREMVEQAHEIIIGNSTNLSIAQTDIEFQNIWKNIRYALSTFDEVAAGLQLKRLISETNAVYLSAIMATFSAVLAFFLFDENRKKFYSNIVIYAAFLAALYFIYPGAHIIVNENFSLFMQSVIASFAAVTAIVFGIPRIWKERVIEGEVSWRSAITVIFSMGKREIRRRRTRGFFTLLSIIILVLAFVSLTSFGSAYGMVSDRISRTAPADGVIVKRMMNATSLLFHPLGFNDSKLVSQWASISNIAERFKNVAYSEPVVRLVNSRTRENWVIYGVMGITPSTESMYTGLNQIVESGSYLNDNSLNEVILTVSVATRLGVTSGETLTLEVLGTAVSRQVSVVGLIGDNGYLNLIDMDGNPFGPIRITEGQVRRCNETEIIIMNALTAKNIQRELDAEYGSGAKQFVVLSDFVFQPTSETNMDQLIKNLIYWLNYDVLVASNGVITYYHIGSYFELKGYVELLIPLIMVGLNVGMVMMNAVYERRKEIRTLSMLGLNPTHIGLIFVAEAVILGMVGGSLGYLTGLGFSRIMVLFGAELNVKEKLEWWWSAAGFALAMAASIISSIRPAALAVSTYTPSMVKKVKRKEEEAEVRKEEIFKVYQERQLSMPIKILTSEKEFFISFFLDRLNELKSGFIERIENVVQTPEKEDVKGVLVLTIDFNYVFGAVGSERATKNSLIMAKNPNEDYYRVRLVSKPGVPGLPESAIERTINFVHETCLTWAKDKERYLGTV
ncbi:ABC transporter permease [Candidatus Bathyarchaeota archaeon]|nr:ABC transporter permease [Candidatus Bathyarchaeota archaeon]